MQRRKKERTNECPQNLKEFKEERRKKCKEQKKQTKKKK